VYMDSRNNKGSAIKFSMSSDVHDIYSSMPIIAKIGLGVRRWRRVEV